MNLFEFLTRFYIKIKWFLLAHKVTSIGEKKESLNIKEFQNYQTNLNPNNV